MTLPDARTPAGSAGLAALLADPARALVAVDYDGTLAPIIDDPAAAVPHPEAVRALGTLAAVVGTVAIITGRPVHDVLRLGGVTGAAGLDRLVICGQYGLERWSAETGELSSPEVSAGVRAALREVPEILASVGLQPGALEDKRHALAVHTRREPDPDAALAVVEPKLRSVAAENGLEVVAGRYVLELRPPGIDKGRALLDLADERGCGSVVFAGDDLGDLPAFEAVEELRRRGIPGVLVCAGSAEVSVVADRADLVVDGAGGVVALLTRLTAAVGAG